MLWNPTAATGEDGRAVGGRHYIYVTNQPYDGCENLGETRVKNLNVFAESINSAATAYEFIDDTGDTISLVDIYEHVAWTTIPLLTDAAYEFADYCGIPTDVTIKLRVNESFKEDEGGETPRFYFDMGPYAAVTGSTADAEEAVDDLINIVPNPFYGRSGTGRGTYELSQLDSRVKITNLPQEADIRIYTLNGQLVRTFRKQSDSPDQEWDLKNDSGVPIASGMYIIHVDAGDYGEKVLKFLAIMPELDLNAY
ncbi:MAG: T9SS type A sorting domain-containing protein [Bacteroidota bacterium]